MLTNTHFPSIMYYYNHCYWNTKVSYARYNAVNRKLNENICLCREYLKYTCLWNTRVYARDSAKNIILQTKLQSSLRINCTKNCMKNCAIAYSRKSKTEKSYTILLIIMLVIIIIITIIIILFLSLLLVVVI